jgi:8-oxo-dGTP diphosphatase
MPPAENVFTGVSVWIQDIDGDVLLMQRKGKLSKFQDGDGSWSLPGGWMNFGETPEETAIRECQEELNVGIECSSRLGFVTDPSDDGERWKVTLVIKARIITNTPEIMEPDKCSALIWVRPGKLPVNLFPPLRSFIVEYGLPE